MSRGYKGHNDRYREFRVLRLWFETKGRFAPANTGLVQTKSPANNRLAAPFLC